MTKYHDWFTPKTEEKLEKVNKEYFDHFFNDCRTWHQFVNPTKETPVTTPPAEAGGFLGYA